MACSVAHLDSEYHTVGSLETPLFPRLTLVKAEGLTMQVNCRHCEDAPCANACPVGAIRQIDNAIVVDSAALLKTQTSPCVGCKTCLLACPFGAIELVPMFHGDKPLYQLGLTYENMRTKSLDTKELFTANKCDLCRKKEDGPACVRNCPEKALEVIDPARNRKEKNLKAALGLLDRVGNLTV
jgi:electron transport protein HydN